MTVASGPNAISANSTVVMNFADSSLALRQLSFRPAFLLVREIGVNRKYINNSNIHRQYGFLPFHQFFARLRPLPHLAITALRDFFGTAPKSRVYFCARQYSAIIAVPRVKTGNHFLTFGGRRLMAASPCRFALAR
jgi:hypothetical protein